MGADEHRPNKAAGHAQSAAREVNTPVWFTLALLVLVAALFVPHAAAAVAPSPLTGLLIPLSPRPRSDAPMPVEARLDFHGTGLLEGVLEVSTHSYQFEGVLRFRSQTLTLTAGPRTVPLLLPASLLQAMDASGDALQLRFLSGERSFELTPFEKSWIGENFIRLTIAVCRSRSESPSPENEHWQHLRMDEWLHPLAENHQRPRAVNAMRVDAADLPVDPLAYCAYDLLLVEGQGFSELKTKQLAALQAWVRAGGCVCVIPGRGLKPEHVEFLNRLASETPGAAFLLNADGTLEVPAAFENTHFRCGLGRAAVLDVAALSDADWDKSRRFLWRSRPDNLPREQSRNHFNELSALLLPNDVRMIPGGLLLGILGGFLVLIGPADYWMLGKLRKRRLTWVLFPLLALACTGAVMAMAAGALGKNSRHTTLLITDLARDGKVVRENRLEMIFSAFDQQIDSDVHHALFSPALDLGQGMYSRGAGPQNAPALEGQFPARYTLRQEARKWSPLLSRFLSIEPGPDTSGLPWELFASDAPTAESAAALKAWLQSNPQCNVRRLGGPQPGNLANAPELIPENVLAQITSCPSEGAFLSVSQFAPNGAADLRDLILHDPKEPSPELILVTRRESETLLHLYRRVMK